MTVSNVNEARAQEPTDEQVDQMLWWQREQRENVDAFSGWVPKHMSAPVESVGVEVVMNRWSVPRYRLTVISNIGWYGTSPETALPWWHVSVSTPSRVPTWGEMTMVKEMLLSGYHDAYMVCPPRREYVNLNENVLHWWARQDGMRVLPAFSEIINGVRTI